MGARYFFDCSHCMTPIILTQPSFGILKILIGITVGPYSAGYALNHFAHFGDAFSFSGRYGSSHPPQVARSGQPPVSSQARRHCI
jgi:hypothetical protein